MSLRAPWRSTLLHHETIVVEDVDERIVASVDHPEDARRISCLPELRYFVQEVGAIHFEDMTESAIADLQLRARQIVAKMDGAS